MGPITNDLDRIDSRDVLTRITELETERDDWQEQDEQCAWVNQDPDAAEELELLIELVSDMRQIGGDTPEDGIHLVRESDWEAYAEEYWEDTTDSSDRELASKWPYTHIDWEAAARELQYDYTSVEFDGVTYYGR